MLRVDSASLPGGSDPTGFHRDIGEYVDQEQNRGERQEVHVQPRDTTRDPGEQYADERAEHQILLGRCCSQKLRHADLR